MHFPIQLCRKRCTIRPKLLFFTTSLLCSYLYILHDAKRDLLAIAKCLLYFRYKGTVVKNRYGPGNGRIWMDNVQCVGNETSIDDCDHAGWSVHNCNHTKDVAVSCGTSPVQHGNSNISVVLAQRINYV